MDAMHHCLLVAEIFELIAQFTYEGCASSSAPAALARTCRAFYDIAQDVLWRDLKNLTPLLSCFDRDICTVASEQYHFVRLPKGNDWDRFTHHARRVHTLALGQGLDSAAEMRALQVLELCRPDATTPLLPNLRQLHWCDLKTPAFRYLSLFVHASLDTLNVLIISNPLLLAELLNYLSKSASGLRHLRISPGVSERDDPAVLSNFTKLLRSLTDITELSLKAPVGADNLPLLAQLPRLEVLSARLPSQFTFSPRASAHDDTCFASLRKLAVYAEQLDDVVHLLSHVESHCLTELTVHVKAQPTAAAFEKLFASAAQHMALQILTVMLQRSIGQHIRYTVKKSDSYIIGASSIRSLLRLNRLSHLTLPQIPVALDDQLLRDAASAWPCLEKLSLGTKARLDNTSVSLTGIRLLISSCKNLSELGVIFNSSLGAPDRQDGPSKQSLRLKTFDVGCSSIHDICGFANFVIESCPNARICDPHGPNYRRTSMNLICSEVDHLKAIGSKC